MTICSKSTNGKHKFGHYSITGAPVCDYCDKIADPLKD